MPELTMEMVRNIRDIGGVAARSGMRVTPGRLYRSASPHEMSPADRSLFVELGITTMVDLRTLWEVERQPYLLEGVRHISIPLAAEDAVSSITDRFMAGRLSNEELEDWWELVGIYTAPETQIEGITAFFGILLDLPPREALLFHCRGGKDRTGLLAALILEILGVERDQVLRDFLRSTDAPHQGPSMEARAMRTAMQKMELSRGAIRSLSGVQAAWLLNLLMRLEATYGSIQGYVADHVGIGLDGIEKLQDLYLESSAG